MAILKNLIVNGASRFIGKTYFSDVDISGTASLSSLSLSGNLSVTGTSTFTGAATFSNTVNATGNITSSGNLYANGGYLYLQNKIAADGGKTTANQLTINGSNAFTIGTYIKNILKTDTLNATNVNVTNNLRANHYDLQTVAQLGGSFYVSPTVKFPNSGTTLAVAKSGTTLTLTITDSSITSATMAGVVWTAGSGVKVSGTINGVVTGTMDGTVSSINTSSHTLTLSVSGENSENVQASPSGSPYTASQFKDLSVMLYTRKQDGTSKMINTASGAIASFTDGGNNVPVKQLVVDIEPVQDLHGQANPYPAGGGKNLLPLDVSAIKAANTRGSWSGNVYTDSTGFKFTITLDADGNVNGIVVSGTGSNVGVFYIRAYDVPNGSYTVNGVPSGASWGSSNTFRIRIGDKTDAYINDCLSNGVTVSTTNGFNLQINVASGYTANNLTFKPMIRLSSVSDATFAPYSNICPISGHTSATVTRTGKNVLPSDITWKRNNSGNFVPADADTSTTRIRTSTFAIKNGTYKVSGIPSGSSILSVRTFDESETRLDEVSAPNNVITLGSKVAYIHILFGGSNYDSTTASTFANLQLEVGTTATAYESPNIQTVTIDLDGTRYGGTLDVTTGVLTVETEIKTLNGSEGFWSGTAVASGTRRFYTDMSYANKTVVACDSAKISTDTTVLNIICVSGNRLIMTPSWAQSATTIADFKTLLASNNVTIIQTLANPFTVQLSKTEVRTLQGYNNIWSNTGDTNVIYESSQADSTNNYNVGIWMNCYDQANSSSTIRVYDGSSRWPNVFLGNMTNADLPRVNGNAPYGYGLYSDNVFLRGIISATGGLIGNWTIGTTGMYYNSDAPGSTSITMIPGGTAASTTSIGGSSGFKQWIFTGKNLFGIDTTGKLYASSAEISGKITATSGAIGGFDITATAIKTKNVEVTSNADNSISLSSADFTRTINSTSREGLRFAIGDKLGVTGDGIIYASSVDLSGTITATGGTIGGCSITNGVLKIAEANISGKLSANVIDASELSVGRTQYKTGIKTSSTIVAGHIICGTSSGYVNIGQGVSFDLSYPLLYAASTVSSGSTTQNVYFQYDDVVPTINGTVSGGSFYGQTLFLKGTVSGKTFTISSNPYLTTNIPNNYVSDYYIPLGTYSGSSSTKIQFISSNQLYAYINGTFQPVDMAARRYITDISSGGIKVSYASSPTNYLQITADGTSIYKNSIQVANYGSSIILGELASGKTHVEIDSDSFDICSGATTGANSTKLATFGTDSVIGNMSARGVSINDKGFKFNDGGKTAFYVGVDTRSGSTSQLSTDYYLASDPETITVNEKDYYYVTTVPVDRTVIEVGHSLPLIEEGSDEYLVAADWWMYHDWIINDDKLWIADIEDSEMDESVCYIYTKSSSMSAPYCIIGKNAYTLSNAAGNMSFAQGHECMALGAYSTSVGWKNLSSGTASISSGNQSKAYGNYSFAGGFMSTTQNDNTFAYGYKANACGESSIAFGNQDCEISQIFKIKIVSYNSDTDEITCNITENADYFEMCLYQASILVTTDNNYIFESIEVTSGSGSSNITFVCYSRNKSIPTINSYLYVRVDPAGSYGEGAMSINSCCASDRLSTALGLGTVAPAAGLAIGAFNVPETNVLFSVGNGSAQFNRNNAMTVDMFGNVKATKFQGKQKILWQGGYYMTANHTCNLSETVSEQSNGIVLLWSGYANSAPQNYDWFHQFVPKDEVIHRNGMGLISGVMANAPTSGTGVILGNKYVYVYNDRVVGSDFNGRTATGGGITLTNTHWVLRAVIGV